MVYFVLDRCNKEFVSKFIVFGRRTLSRIKGKRADFVTVKKEEPSQLLVDVSPNTESSKDRS